ncbi:hypothetical protein Hanom_Chr06g00489371 [Helianthus anomalus]
MIELRKDTDIRKIRNVSVKYWSILVNIADIIGTDILTDILHRYLYREWTNNRYISDLSVIYKDINCI